MNSKWFLQGGASQSLHKGPGSGSIVGPPESLVLAQKRLQNSSDGEEKQVEQSSGFDGFGQSQSEISIPVPEVEIQSMDFGDTGKKSPAKEKVADSDNNFVQKMSAGVTESYVSETGVVQKKEL